MAAARPLNLPDSAPERWNEALEAEAGQRLGAFDAALIRRLLADESTSLEAVERALRAYTLANSIGALAARRGWLNMRQIFELFNEPGPTAESFGEAAQRRGFLTADQVAALAEQQEHEAPLLTIAELLVRMGLHVAGAPVEPTPDANSCRPRSAV